VFDAAKNDWWIMKRAFYCSVCVASFSGRGIIQTDDVKIIKYPCFVVRWSRRNILYNCMLFKTCLRVCFNFYCVRSHPFTVAYGLISSSVARPGGYIAKLYIFCLVYIYFLVSYHHIKSYPLYDRLRVKIEERKKQDNHKMNSIQKTNKQKQQKSRQAKNITKI